MTRITAFLLFVTIVHAEADPSSRTYLPASRYHTGYSSYPTASGGRQKEESYRYSGLTGSTYTSKHYAGKYPFSLESSSGRETWSPSVAWNGTRTRYQSQYVRPGYRPDSVEGGYSMYQYQHVPSPIAYKKTLPYYSKFSKTPEKVIKKKPQIAYYPTGYRKTSYPKVHNPYAMHKFPTMKTVHPYYRRYYQAYAMPSVDMLRNPVKNVYAEAESSTAETATEERNDYAASSEDYANYNSTHPSRPTGYSTYYDNYEEQTTSEPSAYDETSTRGYYGDRIYMSSHGGSDTGFRHRLYVARNKPEEEEEDDDETIFD